MGTGKLTGYRKGFIAIWKDRLHPAPLSFDIYIVLLLLLPLPLLLPLVLLFLLVLLLD